MKRLFLAAIAAIGLTTASGASGPLKAQDASTVQVDQSAHADLYDAMREGIDDAKQIDVLVATFAQQLTIADPNIVRAEAVFPGLSTAIAQGIRPVFEQYSNRVVAKYRGQLISAMADTMSADEARQLAGLYRSNAGRNLMSNLSSQYTGQATMADALGGKNISADAIEADTDAAAYRSASMLSSEDQEVFASLEGSSALEKLNEFSRKSTPIRVQMENEALTPEEEAKLVKLMTSAVEDHIAKAGK